MFRLKKNAHARHARAAFATFVVTLLMAFAGAGTASAASYEYCDYCIITAGGGNEANSYVWGTLNYVHRLSGPGSGVRIGAIAHYADNGSWGNWAWSYTTEVTHGYSGTRPFWAAAGNAGAGNYRFNAHVNY